MRAYFLLVLASSVACQELPVSYNAELAAETGVCAPTQELKERIDHSFTYR